jgi:L-alanine-DL-glutamate epimerase-like enolase superfamily enzyme
MNQEIGAINVLPGAITNRTNENGSRIRGGNSRITSIENIQTSIFTMPTERPESDAASEWKSTTMILVKARAGGREGIGYTYGHPSIATFIESVLAPVVREKNVLDVMAIQAAMINAIRNDGVGGMAMMAVSAVDIAIWDLKAKLAGLPLCQLLGQYRTCMKVYGSGGFTSYSEYELHRQLEGWAGQGIGAVKMKVGRDPGADLHRIGVARKAVGNKTSLFVDADGVYTVNQALAWIKAFGEQGIDWVEEPVATPYTEELRRIRQQAGPGMRIAAGEYGCTLAEVKHLLDSGALDVLQADATRCGGITGWLKAGYLCEAYHIPLSSSRAPAAHLHIALAAPSFSIGEYYHDHVRMEQRLFEGIQLPKEGVIYPDAGRPGLGITLKESDAEMFRVA